MDNITHSLVGVALADLAVRQRSPRVQRPMLVGAGIIASNAPDIDLAFSRITPPPIGYLLHHRGHTHTIIGLAGLALLLVAIYRAVPFVRNLPVVDRFRLWIVIVVGLAGHLLLDALNSYGIHPFHPFDSRWYYGDALFIIEPSLWIVLGISASVNGRSPAARLSAALPLLVLLFTIASTGDLPIESLVALALVGLSFTLITMKLASAFRAGVALMTVIAIGIGMFAISRRANAAAGAALEPELRGRLVDVIMTPHPAFPLCWSVIGIELNEGAARYRLWRGTLSLASTWITAASCASPGSVPSPATVRVIGNGGFALRDVVDQSLPQLRELARRDCWARAWLRFGRAPVVEGGQLFDLRFADRRTRNFTHMRLAREPGDPMCPGFVPGWGMPRADLIGEVDPTSR